MLVTVLDVRAYYKVCNLIYFRFAVVIEKCLGSLALIRTQSICLSLR